MSETAASVRRVKCPMCGKESLWSADNPYRPFCSERCRKLDLGAWASEHYRVPQSTRPEPEEESPAG